MSPKPRCNVVDSSAWLEYFADSASAAHFAPAIEDTARLIVPSICLVEVFRKVLRESGEGPALQAAAAMQQGRVVALDAALALTSAKLGVRFKLPLADSIIYATADMLDGIVWTQDEHFEHLPDVRYFPKK